MKSFLFFLCLVPGIMVGQSKSLTWQDFSFGSPALHVKMPGILTKQQTKLPPKAQEQVKSYEAYYLKDDPNGIVITVMYALYASVVADAKGAIDGVIVDGARLWQVIVMTKANDASLKSVMQKITDSISF